MSASERAVEYFIREELQSNGRSEIRREEILNSITATPQQVDFVLRHLEQHNAITLELNGASVYIKKGRRAVV